jgi:hypothetical protein
MRKTNFALRLQPSLLDEARKLAEAKGVALNQLINARWSVRPAPTMATCGTTTRLAKRPAIMPKFDKVIVAPRNSSGGIDRAAASARMRSRPARKSALSRSPTLKQDGNDQAAFKIDSYADVDAF